MWLAGRAEVVTIRARVVCRFPQGGAMSGWIHDVTHAWRSFRRAPWFFAGLHSLWGSMPGRHHPRRHLVVPAGPSSRQARTRRCLARRVTGTDASLASEDSPAVFGLLASAPHNSQVGRWRRDRVRALTHQNRLARDRQGGRPRRARIRGDRVRQRAGTGLLA